MNTTKQVFPDFAFVRTADIQPTNPEPGLTRRVGAANDKLMVVEHRMEQGWVGVRHSHPHEQVVYVVKGHLKVTCGEATFEVRTGDSFVVRGGIEHQASAFEKSFVIDVFTPSRADYI